MNAAVEVVVSPAAARLFQENSDRARYTRCIKASKRVRWDIDADVFRGRVFDFQRKFLPDGLTEGQRSAVSLRRRETLDEPGAGPYLRVPVRPGGALHQRQDARACLRRTGSATRWRWKGWCVSATRN